MSSVFNSPLSFCSTGSAALQFGKTQISNVINLWNKLETTLCCIPGKWPICKIPWLPSSGTQLLLQNPMISQQLSTQLGDWNSNAKINRKYEIHAADMAARPQLHRIWNEAKYSELTIFKKFHRVKLDCWFCSRYLLFSPINHLCILITSVCLVRRKTGQSVASASAGLHPRLIPHFYISLKYYTHFLICSVSCSLWARWTQHLPSILKSRFILVSSFVEVVEDQVKLLLLHCWSDLVFLFCFTFVSFCSFLSDMHPVCSCWWLPPDDGGTSLPGAIGAGTSLCIFRSFLKTLPSSPALYSALWVHVFAWSPGTWPCGPDLEAA